MKCVRIVTFVPADEATGLAKNLAQHIPQIGDEYDGVCWWSQPKMEAGTEQFRPKGGDLQQEPSVRMEFSVPDEDKTIEAFLKQLKSAHPWDSPVILKYTHELSL